MVTSRKKPWDVLKEDNYGLVSQNFLITSLTYGYYAKRSVEEIAFQIGTLDYSIDDILKRIKTKNGSFLNALNYILSGYLFDSEKKMSLPLYYPDKVTATSTLLQTDIAKKNQQLHLIVDALLSLFKIDQNPDSEKLTSLLCNQDIHKNASLHNALLKSYHEPKQLNSILNCLMLLPFDSIKEIMTLANERGENAFHIAACKHDGFLTLLTTLKTKFDDTNYQKEILPIVFSMQDIFRNTPVHNICKTSIGNVSTKLSLVPIDTLNKLLSQRNGVGKTPLHYLFANPQLSAEFALQLMSFIKKPAHLDMKLSDRVLASEHHHKLLETLLVQDSQQNTLLHIASESQNSDVINVMLKACIEIYVNLGTESSRQSLLELIFKKNSMGFSNVESILLHGNAANLKTLIKLLEIIYPDFSIYLNSQASYFRSLVEKNQHPEKLSLQDFEEATQALTILFEMHKELDLLSKKYHFTQKKTKAYLVQLSDFKQCLSAIFLDKHELPPEKIELKTDDVKNQKYWMLRSKLNQLYLKKLLIQSYGLQFLTYLKTNFEHNRVSRSLIIALLPDDVKVKQFTKKNLDNKEFLGYLAKNKEKIAEEHFLPPATTLITAPIHFFAPVQEKKATPIFRATPPVASAPPDIEVEPTMTITPPPPYAPHYLPIEWPMWNEKPAKKSLQVEPPRIVLA